MKSISILRFIRQFELKKGTDYEGTVSSISSGIHIKGANLWILICSALLASIGLDTNSTAVIIGAMLISPLMSPILGIGLGFGVIDKQMTLESVRNFIKAVLISLITAVIYFKLSPLGQETAELAARTKPTLLDVGIAVFGGVAGIIAGSRIEKSNAIPGVAIATALMPPLCTAGFGLASGSWSYFAGAFYLFFINSVFIALSTYVVVRLLNFPVGAHINEALKKKAQIIAAVSLLVVIIPSVVIFYNVVMEARMSKSAQNFVNNEFAFKHIEVIRWDLSEADSVKVLKIYTIGEETSEKIEEKLKNKLPLYGLKNVKLKVNQLAGASSKTELTNQIYSGVRGMLAVSSSEKNVVKTADSLRALLKIYEPDTTKISAFRNEINVLFPMISNFEYISAKHKGKVVRYFIYEAPPRRSLFNSKEAKKLNDYLNLKFAPDSVRIIIKK